MLAACVKSHFLPLVKKPSNRSSDRRRPPLKFILTVIITRFHCCRRVVVLANVEGVFSSLSSCRVPFSLA